MAQNPTVHFVSSRLRHRSSSSLPGRCAAGAGPRGIVTTSPVVGFTEFVARSAPDKSSESKQKVWRGSNVRRRGGAARRERKKAGERDREMQRSCSPALFLSLPGRASGRRRMLIRRSQSAKSAQSAVNHSAKIRCNPRAIRSKQVREGEADLGDEHHSVHVGPRDVVLFDGELFRSAQHQITDVETVGGHRQPEQL